MDSILFLFANSMKINFEKKIIDGMLSIQTQGHMMEGKDESTGP